MVDPSKVKLGKLPAHHDARTLVLAKYLTADLPDPPAKVDYTKNVGSWPMYKNDTIGDCTCAAAGHMIEAWTTAAADSTIKVTDADILKAYEAISGYDPSTGRNDNGAVELSVLKYWRHTGIGKHKITGFASVEPGNHLHVKQAAQLFGGVYIGVKLPITAQGQSMWTVPVGGPVGPGAPGSWGGHAVNVVGYDSQGLTVITWGKPLRMTWTFWDTYCDEAYALLSKDFVNKTTQLAPVGFNLKELTKDLSLL
jgi:hypothetical protein